MAAKTEYILIISIDVRDGKPYYKITTANTGWSTLICQKYK